MCIQSAQAPCDVRAVATLSQATRLLSSDMQEGHTKVVTLPTVSAHWMRLLLSFIYGGQLTENVAQVDTMLDLLHVADFLQLEGFEGMAMAVHQKPGRLQRHRKLNPLRKRRELKPLLLLQYKLQYKLCCHRIIVSCQCSRSSRFSGTRCTAKLVRSCTSIGLSCRQGWVSLAWTTSFQLSAEHGRLGASECWLHHSQRMRSLMESQGLTHPIYSLLQRAKSYSEHNAWTTMFGETTVRPTVGLRMPFCDKRSRKLDNSWLACSFA